MEQDLLVELECPICTDYMSPPIRQCVTGHNICDNCRRRLPHCALCKGRFTDARNLSLEALALKMRYPCINRDKGCNALLQFGDRHKHELSCPFTGIKCAMEKCAWVGRVEDLPAHWASKKVSSMPYKQCNVCHTKMKRESYYVNMLNAFNHSFWFKCKITNNHLYFAVQFIGRAADAGNYYYEVEIFKPGKSKKKVLLSDYCQTLEVDNTQLFSESKCACIDTDSIASFVSVEQLFIYYLRVYETDEPQVAHAGNPIKPNLPIKFGKPHQQRDRSRGTPRNRNPHRGNHQKDGGFVLL